MKTVYLKAGDRMPVLRVQLVDADDQAVSILDTSTVTFKMRVKGTGTVKVDAAATVDSALEGKLSYAWGATDTDTAGTYEAEFCVNNEDGTSQTVPAHKYIAVVIEARAAP